ncbi:MAG TPA: DNA primase, partial [Sphingobium sp.]
ACCPFHNEKTPSFTINDEKGFYHCFGCGEHGDAIRWMTEQRGLTFMDAVGELAGAAGLSMPVPDPRAARAVDEAGLSYRIMSEAQAWFADQLLLNDHATRYCTRRRIEPETSAAFGLGWAPGAVGPLRRALSNYSEARLVEVGLLAAPDGRALYERFRGRLMIPIHDPRGRVIGFGGRTIADVQPKYLNSPDTLLFDKGRTLFNLHRAAPAVRQSGRLIVVEGYLDVIALAQAGLPEVVASCGTALTEAQMELAWRLCPSPVLCFDGDLAGQRASVKAAIRALPHIRPDKTFSFALLPEGADPDDVVQGGGRQAIEALVGRAVPLVDLLWQHECDGQKLATPEARAALRQRLEDHARAITHRGLSSEYLAEFRRRVDALFPRRGRRVAIQLVSRSLDPRTKVLTAVLRGLARHPDVARRQREQIAQITPRTDSHGQALAMFADGGFGGEMPTVEAVDAMFADDCDAQVGLSFSFHDAKVPAEQAQADLRVALAILLAEQEGVSTASLVERAVALQGH